MNTRRILLTTTVLAVAVLLLFSASARLSASPVPPDSNSAYRVDFPPLDDPPPPSEDTEAVHSPGPSEVEIMGTMWQPQNRKQFKEWIVLGWGSAVRLKPAKAPSDEWVHISPTKVNVLNNAFQRIRSVTICAATSNPTVSRPLAIHMWAENNDRFYMGNISWSNSTARQCRTVNFNPVVSKYGINISLLVRFANGTDQVTLQEVYVGLTD